jgi:peptidoglycan/xylan/chitin deacetylase (PgdA/CDA1 family)
MAHSEYNLDDNSVILKSAKLAALRSARNLGIFAAVNASRWRSRHLLILCYHGVSFADEHLWNPTLYLDPATFRQRMQTLHDGAYNVLPLEEGLRRLSAGTLPSRSVVITIDDGSYNFHARIWPVLREFGFPATVYLSTYYCRRQMPVFDVAAAWLIWKGCGASLDARGILPEGGCISLEEENYRQFFRRLNRSVMERGLSALEKDELAHDLANRLGQDYQELRRLRLFHLMTAEEVAEVSKNGITIELHTHRHRTPRDRDLLVNEIRDNRNEIEAITGRRPSHFCYPCGDYVPEFFGWLHQNGVRSATTCDIGFASAGDEPMRVPRLLDMNSFSPVEFEGWLTGVCAALPRR